MSFAEFHLEVTRRVAAINIAHIVPSLENGILELELMVVEDGQVAPIAFLAEDSPEEERAAFVAAIENVENAIDAQNAEDEAEEEKIRAILEKLTPEERLTIHRPLPEDLPPEDDNEAGG